MEFERLISRYPKLYHMAEDESWESIMTHGLLSTSALLDRFEVEGEERLVIEAPRRPEIVRIEHPEHGAAFIRDNKPMQEKSLERCLHRMTPREWYEHLNRRVYFWVEWRRLLKLLGARAYGTGCTLCWRWRRPSYWSVTPEGCHSTQSTLAPPLP